MRLTIITSMSPETDNFINIDYVYHLFWAIRQIAGYRTVQNIRHYGADSDRKHLNELNQEIGALIDFISVKEITSLEDTALISRIIEDTDAILAATDGCDPFWERIKPLIPFIPVHTEIIEITTIPDYDFYTLNCFLDWLNESKLMTFFGFAAVLPGSLKKITADVCTQLQQNKVPYITLTPESAEAKSRRRNKEIIKRASLLISLSPGICENRKEFLDYAVSAETPLYSFSESSLARSFSSYRLSHDKKLTAEFISFFDKISTKTAPNNLYLPVAMCPKSEDNGG